MCGIAGIIESGVNTEHLSGMLRCLQHRGPEDEGVWTSPDRMAAFGHRRLAIIDLSPLGHQPMSSLDKRYTITFNGEIYNYIELRNELKEIGYTFRGASDTEVLLAAYRAWGQSCVERLNGMFAFAIWDSQERTLFAARDRLGEKPFKYYLDRNRFVFASEIKAILAFPGVPKTVDWQAIDVALSFRYVPAPRTGFANIKKLPAGHTLVWRDGTVSIKPYWQPRVSTNTRSRSDREWQQELWPLFCDAVKKRLISDVPVGAFLSGGIDSTSVVAAMSAVTSRSIDTYVISLSGESEDRKYAKIAADFFHTNHHEVTLGGLDYGVLMQNLVRAYDEPFFDQSALPSMIINSQMKEHVTVVLSGDGGDELFGGYDSYMFAYRLSQFHTLPKYISESLMFLFAHLSKKRKYQAEIIEKEFFTAYSEYYALWKTWLPHSKRYVTKYDLYTRDMQAMVSGSIAPSVHMKAWFGNDTRDIMNAAMRADIVGRLADGYLTKVDIAAMTSAVEVRPPFLDHRLVELAMTIPSKQKIRRHDLKHLWKGMMHGKIPDQIIGRPKVGFALPLGDMLTNQLKPMIEDILLQPKSLPENYFSHNAVKQLWQDHQNKKADYTNHLWSLLMLSLWLKEYSV